MAINLDYVPDALKVQAVSRSWGATRVGFSRKETAWLLGVSIRSIDYLVAQGRLSSFKMGSRRMVRRDSILNVGGHGVLEKMAL